MTILLRSKRSATEAPKGAPESEYRALHLSHSKRAKLAANPPDYVQELSANPDLQKEIRDYVSEYWWEELVQSAMRPDMRATLLKKNLFASDAMMDISDPRCEKLVQTLVCSFLYPILQYM